MLYRKMNDSIREFFAEVKATGYSDVEQILFDMDYQKHQMSKKAYINDLNQVYLKYIEKKEKPLLPANPQNAHGIL